MRTVLLVVMVTACGGESKPAEPEVKSPEPPKSVDARVEDTQPAGPQADPAVGSGSAIVGSAQGSITGQGYAVGPGGIRNRTACVPSLSIGQANVTGDLDKAIVRRYIKRNAQKLRYCYEKELLANDKLEGVLTTHFTITPDGKVKTASASGVSTTVADCAKSVIETIEFPKPKSNAAVQVEYPFVYRKGC